MYDVAITHLPVTFYRLIINGSSWKRWKVSLVAALVFKLLKPSGGSSEREIHRRDITEDVIAWSSLKRYQKELRELGYKMVQQLEQLEKGEFSDYKYTKFKKELKRRKTAMKVSSNIEQ